jgi:repressor LexA
MANKLGENIRKLRNSKGLTQQQLAELMGASNYTTVSKWESGSNSPRGGELVKLSEYFNVSVDDLLGIGKDLTIQNNEQYNYLPTSISAGLPLTVDGIDHAEKISVPDSIMGKWAGDKDIYMMRINGESMNRIIPHGSIIAIKPTECHLLKDGDIVVYSDNHDYSVKRYFRDDNRIIFRPDSNDSRFYDYITSTDNENLVIHGKVVVYIVELD